MTTARFIYDLPEKNADLYYIVRFLAPDPIIFFECRGKKYLVLNDLEFDRGRRTADVNKVLSLSEYTRRAGIRNKSPGLVDIIHEVFRDYKVKDIVVPDGTSFTLVDGLRKRGYKITAGDSPFYLERQHKSKKELKHMTDAQHTVFAAMDLARGILKASRIKGTRLVYKGNTLTSEWLKKMIDIFLFERGFDPAASAPGTIAAGGRYSADPHETGIGPLAPHKSIIVDIFPRSTNTLYFGDATRTFCRGRAPEALKKMYAIVKEGQELGIKMVRAGINGRKIHEAIISLFDKRGYKTGEKDGRRQGFIHGTGHGIGLEIHEEPARIRAADYILKTGNVMSVEPGLYYTDIGGVRIEDLIVVTPTGCRVLSGYPKQLEIL